MIWRSAVHELANHVVDRHEADKRRDEEQKREDREEEGVGQCGRPRDDLVGVGGLPDANRKLPHAQTAEPPERRPPHLARAECRGRADDAFTSNPR
jgi:hypothetical protein